MQNSLYKFEVWIFDNIFSWLKNKKYTIIKLSYILLEIENVIFNKGIVKYNQYNNINNHELAHIIYTI